MAKTDTRSPMRRLAVWLVAIVCTVVAIVALVFVPFDVGSTRIRNEVDIARPPNEVYRYVTTPANWPRWHPSSIAVAGDASHSLAMGESVVEEFKVAGRHGFVTWRVVDSRPDRSWRIDGEIDGRVSGTVSYALSANGDGTHFVRVFDYPSPTLLFAVLNALVLKDKVAAESTQAVEQLRSVLEAGTSS